jgi:hypothetical protein
VSSRIAYGVEITHDRLARVERVKADPLGFGSGSMNEPLDDPEKYR